MKSERIVEILSSKKRGYMDIPTETVNMFKSVNDAYYIGRKFQLKRHKDGRVELTNRKNLAVITVLGGEVTFGRLSDINCGRWVKADTEMVIRMMKSINDNYAPLLA